MSDLASVYQQATTCIIIGLLPCRQLYTAIQTIQDHLELQKDVDSLGRVVRKWGIEFNTKECEVMYQHINQTTPAPIQYLLWNPKQQPIS